MFMLHVSAPFALPICAAKMYARSGSARKLKKKQPRQKKNEGGRISAKLTDKSKQKMFISCILRLLSSSNKASPRCLLYYNLFEMPIWFGIGLVNRQPRKAKFGNCSTTIRMRYAKLNGRHVDETANKSHRAHEAALLAEANEINFPLSLSDIAGPARIFKSPFAVLRSQCRAECHASIQSHKTIFRAALQYAAANIMDQHQT